MFLNKFWDWVGTFDDPLSVMCGALIPITFGIVGLSKSHSYFWNLLFVVLWIGLAEWMYVDYVKAYKKPEGLVLAKIGCLLGTLPFVIFPISILANIRKIIQFVINIVLSPEAYWGAIILLSIVGVGAIIALYFWINVAIAKKIIKNNNKRKKGGK